MQRRMPGSCERLTVCELARDTAPSGRRYLPSSGEQAPLLVAVARRNEVTGHDLRAQNGQGLLVVTRRQRDKDEVAASASLDASASSRDRDGRTALMADRTTEVAGLVTVVVRSGEAWAIIRLLEALGLHGSAGEEGGRSTVCRWSSPRMTCRLHSCSSAPSRPASSLSSRCPNRTTCVSVYARRGGTCGKGTTAQR